LLAENKELLEACLVGVEENIEVLVVSLV